MNKKKRNLRIIFYFFCASLCVVVISPPSVVAQDYVVKKKESSGFWGRLFGKGKNAEDKSTPSQQVRPVLRQNTDRNKKGDVFQVEPVPTSAPVYDYDSDGGVDVKAMLKDVIGECTEEDRRAMAAFNQMHSQFKQDMEQYRTEGELPEGYEFPEGEDPESYEEYAEEDFDDIQPPGGMTSFLAEEGRMEQVMAVQMRCTDMQAAMKEARQKEAELEEQKKQRRQR